ncbi:MAG: alpha/beta hydrolase [Chloroflexi bacterium]|nr:MAG: alpha/beta hydrolase [Chloroflexota bacterium]
MRRFLKSRWFGFLLILLISVVITFVVWAATPQGEVMQAALDALKSDDAVTVTTEPWLIFTPTEQTTDVGFIFYPGGRVLPEAYSPSARAIAEAGYLTIIVPMPLNLAFFNPMAAQSVIDAYPEIQHWVIGGHSLGGAMAAAFAHDNPDKIDGLVLWAAYPADFHNLSTYDDLAVTVVYGEYDGLASVETIEESAALLPDDAEFVMIKGGNHAYFGWYGAQPGDNEALITREQQQAKAVEATIAVLEQLAG